MRRQTLCHECSPNPSILTNERHLRRSRKAVEYTKGLLGPGKRPLSDSKRKPDVIFRRLRYKIVSETGHNKGLELRAIET